MTNLLARFPYPPFPCQGDAGSQASLDIDGHSSWPLLSESHLSRKTIDFRFHLQLVLYDSQLDFDSLLVTEVNYKSFLWLNFD